MKYLNETLLLLALVAPNARGFHTPTTPDASRPKKTVLKNSYLDNLSKYSAHKQEQFQQDEDGAQPPAQHLDNLSKFTALQQQQQQVQPINGATMEETVPVNGATATMMAPPPMPINNGVSVPTTETFPVIPMRTTSDALNGWVIDIDEPLYGLPGAISPLGYFDPLGYGDPVPLKKALWLREAEISHGRVAMLATVGFLAGQAVSVDGNLPLTGREIQYQLEQVPAPILWLLALAVTGAELYRAKTGWMVPNLFDSATLFTLKDDYYPGDIGFDPLELKPRDVDDFVRFQNTELSNGRLAMIAIAGLVAQDMAT